MPGQNKTGPDDVLVVVKVVDGWALKVVAVGVLGSVAGVVHVHGLLEAYHTAATESQLPRHSAPAPALRWCMMMVEEKFLTARVATGGAGDRRNGAVGGGAGGLGKLIGRGSRVACGSFPALFLPISS